MNSRFLLAIGFSLASVFLFQYFTQKNNVPASVAPGTSARVVSGQEYSTPVKQCWSREPNREIDFVDMPIDGSSEQLIAIETPLYKAQFSNFGGVLKELSYKKHKGKDGQPLETINQDTVLAREEGCFLIAFDEKTPYVYQMVSQNKKEDRSEIIYQANVEGWLIRKTFVMYNASYKIDLKLDFEVVGIERKPIFPRLFYPSPYLAELSDDLASGFVTKDGKSIEKISASKELSTVWGMPELFGAENKFFAHALIKDVTGFSQGGYYKRINHKLFSILEGSEIKEKKSYDLSFYMGPKLVEDLCAVDSRLEDLLAFGWLSWICKLMLKFLDFLYQYLGNFGLAIVVLTILLKIPFLPLSISSRRKLDQYQKFQPTINRIREKYRHDLKKQQEEIMLFHKEHDLSPATPMVGCLPLLVQLPILFALYRILNNYLALYQAPFFGWIHDLSAKDPYYVLPILMGIAMLIQQLMTSVADEKQRIMMLFMPVLMTVLFMNFAAGLVLYWFMNNLLTLAEDLLRKKLFN